MSSGPQGGGNQTAFSSGTPHFLTTILEETLQENKLWIPQHFIRKCGETLSNSVFVKLPCGSKWKMKLTKQDDNVWLEKGWPDFAKHYSIKRGSMLSFRYEGNSEFHVVIFDTSTVEIDYPSIPVQFDKSDIDLELRAPKQEVVEDDSVEFLDDLSPCPKARAKCPLPDSQPHKRMRMSPNAEGQSNSFDPKSKGSDHSESVLGNSMTKGNLQSSEPEMIGKHDLPSRRDNGISSAQRQRIYQILRRIKRPINRSENVSALRKASVFESRRPFFKVVIQQSYLCHNSVTFSSIFAKRYIKSKSCNVILKVLDGRTWSLKYTLGVDCRFRTRFHPRFHSGWREFSRDNNLEVGDVCVFVLLEGIETAFEVVIFRVNGISKTPISQAREGGKIQVEPEQILTNETQSGGAVNYETGEPSSLDSAHAKRASKYVCTTWKTSQRSVTPFERARILESIPFESEKPFFKLVMQPSYVGCKAKSLRVPLDFAMRYMKNQGDVVLSVPNGRSWFAEFRMSAPRFIGSALNLIKGWRKFAEDNNLEVGDVCIFKLLDRTRISFEVFIVRFAEYECLLWSQAGNYATSASKSMAYAKSGGDESTTTRKKTDQILQRVKTQMYRSEKVTSLQKANAFKSSRPFFKVVIQPSDICGDHLDLPDEFARTHLKNKSNDATLMVSRGGNRTWPVDYNFIMHEKTSTARFEYGWIPFAQDNNLEVGDVCIFVLLDCTKTTFRVVIFRVNEKSKSSIPPAHEGQAIPVEAEEILTNEIRSGGTKNDETGEPSWLFSVLAKQGSGSGCMPPPWKTSQRPITPIERARILESIPFESEKPFFEAVMQPSYVGSEDDSLCVPLDFAVRYLKKQCDVILSVPNGRSWFAEFRMTPAIFINYDTRFGKGWPEFAKDNNLEVGDVCFFKLLDGTKISFEVSIVRFAEYERNYAAIASKQMTYAKRGRNKFTTRRKKTYQILRRRKTQVCRSEKVSSLQKAMAFKSSCPFFKVVIQPSNIYGDHLEFPHEFARTHLKNKSNDAILTVSCGGIRTWPVDYNFIMHEKASAARFENGWIPFAQDNNLEVGNVCVFVLLDCTKTTFRVEIFRANENSKSSISPAHEGQAIPVEAEEILTNEIPSGGTKNDETGKPSSLDSVPTKQASEYMPTSWKTNQGPLTSTKRARILERVPFESEKPFFKVLMQPTYVGPKADHLRLPINFVMTYIESEGSVVLSVPNGRSWFAELRVTPPEFVHCHARLSKGWTEFANDNNLEVGDVCIFKLLDGPKVSFEVTIVRFAEYECNYAASANKPMAYAKSGRKTDQILRRIKTQMYRSEKDTSLQKAIAFKSSRPFFKVVIQPSHIYDDHMDFPLEFARTHLKNKSNDAILIVSGGRSRTWPVDYNFIMHEKTSTARFEYGWISFAQDNNLEVGDVCVFVLLDCTKTTFRVVIFRVNENLKSSIPQAHEDRATPVEAEEIRTNETPSGGSKNDKTSEPSSLFSVPAKQYMPTPWKTSQRPITPFERAIILESIPFESEKPFFKIVMQPSYVGSKTEHLPLPLNFFMTYIENEGGVVLSVPNGRSWFAELRTTPSESINCAVRLCKGWHEFANDNNLEVGDVCIFQLLDGTKISFEVTIVRFAKYESPEGQAIPAGAEEILTTETQFGGIKNDKIGEPSSPVSVPAKQASGYMFTPWKRGQRPLTSTERTRILERVPFKSEKPYFKLLMQPSYVGPKAGYLQLPINFVMTYLKNEGGTVLSVPNGRSWFAELTISPRKSNIYVARLVKGWLEFARDNNLEVGDVCIFKLLDQTKLSFEVSIVRFAEHECDYGTSASKPEGAVKVKTEFD